jgi:membrane associated rhomboid family serine protease
LDWRVLITLLGWLAAIGGALRLFGPFVVKTGNAMLNKPYFTSIAAAIWVVLGLLFCFFGYLRGQNLISGREQHHE